MFIQVIEARTGEPRGVREALERWQRELATGAHGWLGTTAGLTTDGTLIGVVRFESAEAARQNSSRPEQGQWWADFGRHFEGEARFDDYEDTDLMSGGGSDTAAFVQVIRGHARDVARLRSLGQEAERVLREHRPEIVGGSIGWKPDGDFTQTVYFTSEAAARQGEANPSPELRDFMESWQGLVEDLRFFDLREPWLMST
jgi:hypothetical protein